MAVVPEISATHRVPCALKVHIKSSFWVRGESRGVICSGSGARRWWQSRRWHHPHKMLYSRHILPKSSHLPNQIGHRSRTPSNAQVRSFKLSRAPCVNTAQDTFNSPQNTLGHRCDPNRESAQLRTRSRECGKDFVSEVRRGGLWTLCRNLRRLHMHLLKAAIVLLIAACSQSQ